MATIRYSCGCTTSWLGDLGIALSLDPDQQRPLPEGYFHDPDNLEMSVPSATKPCAEHAHKFPRRMDSE